ncbi:MAG: hypothetical protein ABSH08_04690 [Tepidisphaeraceae bacterium]
MFNLSVPLKAGKVGSDGIVSQAKRPSQLVYRPRPTTKELNDLSPSLSEECTAYGHNPNLLRAGWLHASIKF